ncbi:helix-turn-helix domain-containing protein [Brevibacterium sp. UMB1308A]|uniref:helix-turn-helix domain-containing protein n=1 Tax=Brevibacterium sp. UMB1308A TaxID=3050608 RepID=UPI002549EEB9|nr:helix-turn-helix domain-containing protein [Brevibacterium sp. UMB1308A]MDK8347600.1 helix-turn-helix domain-containing protein [Brevibacterium sp. UMB1308B]MDK8714493.1 helix-turn-helix domain-containing protein [Brevibacterium sp. UMB1308A]
MESLHLMTTAQVADRLGVTRQAVAHMVNNGVLSTVAQFPKTWLYDPADVEALAEARAKAGAK